MKNKKGCKNKSEVDIMKSDKGGDIVLHSAVAVVAAGARGLPSGWACLVTSDGYFLNYRNILWGCLVQKPFNNVQLIVILLSIPFNIGLS